MTPELKYPVDTKLRWPAPKGKRGRLFHARGYVDGLLVIRTWTHKQRWEYDVIDPEIAIEAVGLYTVEE